MNFTSRLSSFFSSDTASIAASPNDAERHGFAESENAFDSTRQNKSATTAGTVMSDDLDFDSEYKRPPYLHVSDN